MNRPERGEPALETAAGPIRSGLRIFDGGGEALLVKLVLADCLAPRWKERALEPLFRRGRPCYVRRIAKDRPTPSEAP